MSSSSSSPEPSASARVLYPKGDRSSQPAGALQSANLLPDMLAHNLRAGLFPEKGQQIRVRARSTTTDRHFAATNSSTTHCPPTLASLNVSLQNTIEQGLARQAWLEVAAVERLHRRTCPLSTLKHIHTVAPTTATPSQQATTTESVITNFQRPLPTRLYSSLFREAPMPHLDIGRPAPLPSATAVPNAALPQPASGRVDASSGLVYYGARELGSELWTVDRCSVEQQYLVSYYGDGDAFYCDVYPVNWSGAFDCLRLKASRWLGFS